jgi:lipopolysaccharide export system protein LptC
MKLSALNLPGVLPTRKSWQRWLLVLFVGLISLASYWMLEIVRSHIQGEQNAPPTRPDYYVENFTSVKLLSDGQGKYRVEGARLVHYSSDDHADLTHPIFSNLDSSEPLTTVRANRGVIKHISSQIDTEIHLYDEVHVNRPATNSSKPLQLNTDYLLIFPDKNTMETSFPIEIISGKNITRGVGMKANTDAEQLEILSKVYSILAPHTKSNLKP